MGEWMTTGEMVDRLKFGEIAEAASEHSTVKRTSQGIVWRSGEEMKINQLILGYRWHILPKYVSFIEAMKALKDGLVVRAHDGMGGYYEFDGMNTFPGLAKEYSVIKIYELIDMKWTITE